MPHKNDVRSQCISTTGGDVPGSQGPDISTTRVSAQWLMLALVNADYRFLWADMSVSNGCCSDAQVFNDCQLWMGP